MVARQKFKCSGDRASAAIRRLETHGGARSERMIRTPVTAGADIVPAEINYMFRKCSLRPLLAAATGSPYRYRNILRLREHPPLNILRWGPPDAGGDRCQTACKPGSVRGRPPTRWPFIWDARHRAPRATDPGGRSGNRPGAILRPPGAAPTWSCSRRGLPCRTRCRVRGALLPHPFTLARRPCDPERAVCSLWHFPWGCPRRVLPGPVLPWSPDFPPPRASGGDGGHPAVWPVLTTPALGLGQAALSFARQ